MIIPNPKNSYDNKKCVHIYISHTHIHRNIWFYKYTIINITNVNINSHVYKDLRKTYISL